MTPDAARREATRRWPRSVGFQEAFLAGYRARRAGRGPDACPYVGGPRSRTRRGWRVVWRGVWLEGYQAGRR